MFCIIECTALGLASPYRSGVTRHGNAEGKRLKRGGGGGVREEQMYASLKEGLQRGRTRGRKVLRHVFE